MSAVQAYNKQEKKKAIAKGKKKVIAARNEKLVKRNPQRLQQQIDELQELDKQGILRPRDKEQLAYLSKELRAVTRARETLGDAAPKFAERGNARAQQRERREQLQSGKRRRDEDSGSDTDPDVRAIPMPRDTPPPIPVHDPQVGPDGKRVPHALPVKPIAPAQTIYSSAPQIRDLKKEAVRFLPAAVQAQKARVQGKGRLLQPEEVDRLEKAGYLGNQASEEQRSTLDLDKEAERFAKEIAALEAEQEIGPRAVQLDDAEDDGT